MASGPFWTAEEDALLKELWPKYRGSAKALVPHFPGRTSRGITNRKYYLAAEGKWPTAAPLQLSGITLTRATHAAAGSQILAPEQSSGESAASFLDRIFAVTDAAVAKHKSMSYAKLRIVTDKPVGLSLSSDWHLTVRGASRVRDLFSYAQSVAHAQGVLALAVGDLMDTPIKHKPTNISDVPEEYRLLDLLFGRFGGKLAATTDGNHDAWVRTAVGMDHIKEMAAKHQLHYAPDELIYVVEVVSPTTDEVTARWVVATRHKYRRHSNLNYTHSCWRWLEEMANDWPVDTDGRSLLPDVLAIGDNHVAAVEARNTNRGVVWAVRMGAWQVSTSFARQLGFPGSPATAPLVVLPTTRAERVQCFDDHETGLEFLKQVRQR